MTAVRVTVTNVFGPLNRGDFELFDQMVSLLREAGVTDISAIARDPERCREHFEDVTFHAQPGVAAETGGRRGRLLAMFRTLALLTGAWFRPAERLLPQVQRSALTAIREADLVVGCPGGYLTSSSLSYFPQVAQVAYASRRGRRTWLAPMSIGPAHGRLHRWLLRRALTGVDRVYVRETWSEAFCRELGVPSIRSADLAFRPARQWLTCGNGDTKEYLTATVVRWDFPGATDSRAARERYHDAMATALNTLALRSRLPVKLLLQVDNDREVTESVAARLTVPHDIVRVTTPDQNRRILAGSRLMIASRFHSAVFAMTAGCPTVVVSYLPKARSMMEDMGLAALVHDIGEVKAEGLLASADLLDDPTAGYAGRVRRVILEQTCPDGNPFILDLHRVLPRAESAGA